MMGTAPARALGRRLGQRIKKTREKRIRLGRLVGRALVRGGHGHLVELRLGDDLEDWRDPRKVFGGLDPNSGLAGKVVKGATTGGRVLRDLYETYQDRQAGPYDKAEFGPFTVKANSPNTIRVTAGPTRRQRRGKKEWEKVGFQRTAWKAGITAASAGALYGGAWLGKQHPSGGIAKGAQVVASRILTKAKNVGRGIKAVAKNEPFIPTQAHAQNPTLEKKIADIMGRKFKKDQEKVAS